MLQCFFFIFSPFLFTQFSEMDESLVKLHQIILQLVASEQLPDAIPKEVTAGNNDWLVLFILKSSLFLEKSNELMLFFRIHVPLKIEVANDVDDNNRKYFNTTVFELDFLIRLFSDASLFPLEDCYSREFVLEFSKFYAFQCYSFFS